MQTSTHSHHQTDSRGHTHKLNTQLSMQTFWYSVSERLSRCHLVHWAMSLQPRIISSCLCPSSSAAFDWQPRRHQRIHSLQTLPTQKYHLTLHCWLQPPPDCHPHHRLQHEHTYCSDSSHFMITEGFMITTTMLLKHAHTCSGHESLTCI